MFSKRREQVTNVTWLARLGNIIIAGVLAGLFVSAHSRRVKILKGRHAEVVQALRAEAYTEGRLVGMAEAFDVVVEHRQTQAH
jgi:hypothetical protein